MAYGGIPPMSVIVSDAGRRTAFKGVTNANGTFATGNLSPGNYVVQLNSADGRMKGNQYAIVVSAGTKKVAATAVPGEKFAGGGVALRVVVGAGLNITGQVSPQAEWRATGDARRSNQEQMLRVQEHMDKNYTNQPDTKSHF